MTLTFIVFCMFCLTLTLTLIQPASKWMHSEPEEGPPVLPGRGASRMLRGLMHVAEESRSGHTKMRKICWSPGLCPGPHWGSLQRSPKPSSWWRGGLCCPLPNNPTYNIVIMLILCVCRPTHVYENALLFFVEC